MTKTCRVYLIACLTAWSATAALAHEGEDHDVPPPAPAVVQTAPRATAQTDLFEMVAESSQSTLTLYLNRFDTNEPVDKATVEVESGSFKTLAKAQSPGVYVIAAPPLSKPGDHPLTVSVTSEMGSDLLDVRLKVPPEAVQGKASGEGAVASRSWIWWLAGLLSALGLLTVTVRRQRAHRP